MTHGNFQDSKKITHFHIWNALNNVHIVYWNSLKIFSRLLSQTITFVLSKNILVLFHTYYKFYNLLFYFSIWESLVKMANLQKKTIIITTHYIEEARQANTV